MLSKGLLNIYVYIDGFLLPSIVVRDASCCREQWSMQRLRTVQNADSKWLCVLSHREAVCIDHLPQVQEALLIRDWKERRSGRTGKSAMKSSPLDCWGDCTHRLLRAVAPCMRTSQWKISDGWAPKVPLLKKLHWCLIAAEEGELFFLGDLLSNRLPRL